MKKQIFFAVLFAFIFAIPLFAQFDDLFDDDLFSDDDFFFDDVIEEVADVSASSDLSKGVVFEDGSIKIGGSFSTSVSTATVIYSEESDDFVENLKNTTFNPTVSANLSIDARPTQDLRMFGKAELGYPFKTTVSSAGSVSDYLKIKELFTDFSVADRAFFRFGLHTVTWGTGIFFSPVSDMINTSSIDPEHTDRQVDGSLNLRTQVTFPGTQNCLWTYVIPDTTTKLARDTALAAKGDILFGNWEFGVGGYYKYANAPKAMLTASGSFKKMMLFGEGVYQYGSVAEWAKNNSFEDKSSIFKATAGFMYSWKDPSITLMGQYLYDGSDFKIDTVENLTNSMVYSLGNLLTQGHNLAFAVNFSKLFNSPDLSLAVFGNLNYGRTEKPDFTKGELAFVGMLPGGSEIIKNINQIFDAFPVAYGTLTLNYASVKDVSFGFGPSFMFKAYDKAPDVSLNLSVSLGGGRF